MPPVKDLLDVLVWAGAFCGNQITWRGGRYRILPGGKLAEAAPRRPAIPEPAPASAPTRSAEK
jgi:hypothetical protein